MSNANPTDKETCLSKPLLGRSLMSFTPRALWARLAIVCVLCAGLAVFAASAAAQWDHPPRAATSTQIAAPSDALITSAPGVGEVGVAPALWLAHAGFSAFGDDVTEAPDMSCPAWVDHGSSVCLNEVSATLSTYSLMDLRAQTM